MQICFTLALLASTGENKLVWPHRMVFARREANKAWKRLKVTGAGRKIAGAKNKYKVIVLEKQCTNGKTNEKQ